jgi:hypothetical protein
VEGIQLLCRRHNDYEGRLYFGSRRTGKQRTGQAPDLNLFRNKLN